VITAVRTIGRSVVLSIVFLFVASASAQAAFHITSFGGSATDPAGDRSSQAGAHPDVRTRFTLSTRNENGGERTDGSLRNADVELPPGLTGDPTKTDVCENDEFYNESVMCSAESQVGVLTLRNPSINPVTLAIYRRPTPLGSVAQFATNFNGVIVALDAKVRVGSDGQYRVVISSIDTAISIPLSEIDVVLWGVPADPSNDDQRVGAGLFGNVPGPGSSTPSNAQRAALILAPTSCPTQALSTTLTATAWEEPNSVQTASFDHDFDGFPIRTEGCGRLAFTPTVQITPDSRTPDAPTGLRVKIHNPQNVGNPDGLANAQLRDVTVQMPEGLTINPGSANGLQACSDQQLGLGGNGAADCPDASKLGTVTATSPVLEEPIEGNIYLRSQASDNPESGEMFRIALVLKNEDRGVLVKLPGALRVSESTGRITASFKDNPQLPVEDIALDFKSGARGPLVTPAECGSKSIAANLVSWAGQNVDLTNDFGVDCTSGLGGFAPGLKAGTVSPTAGAFSPLSVNITKPDGNAAANGLRMDLPTGLLAKLKGNLNTQVGTVTAFAGPGSSPYALPGQVYLEGQYGDAPFSLRVVVPAKAGPFDLGDVVVRQKIYVDPITAQVTVVSDPLPTIVKGVPVRLQRLDVNVDKAGFIINPTSCAAKTITATLSSVAGQSVPITNRFQATDCADLELEPKLDLTLSGKGQTTDGKHPAVTASLTQKAGQANLKKVRVALPLALALDPDNANGLCEFADGSKATPTCPKNSIIGTATAISPILDEPVSGPVYFVKNIRKDPKSGRDIKTLPKLVLPLVGQNGVKLTLTGTSDVEDDHLVTTFDNIPDAPVSSFKLNIIGGKGGILTVSGADICKATQIADQQVDGQSNKQADADVYIQTPSCPTKVLSKKVGKTSVTLKVGGLGAGKVTVTGKGIRKTTKTITKSTVATITAKRTKGKPGKVTVSFDPAGPAKARKATK
jgi:hypothetical protein